MRNWSANTEQNQGKRFLCFIVSLWYLFSHIYIYIWTWIYMYLHRKKNKKTLQIFSLLQKSSIYIWAENRSKRVCSLITNLLSVISICSLITTLLSVMSAMDFDAKWLPPWLKDIHHVHRLCSRQCHQKKLDLLAQVHPNCQSHCLFKHYALRMYSSLYLNKMDLVSATCIQTV